MTVLHRAGVQQPIRLRARPTATLDADLCAATPKAWPGTIIRWTGNRTAVCEPGLAGVFPSGRTAKFAADLRLGIDRRSLPDQVRLRPPYGHDGGAAVIA